MSYSSQYVPGPPWDDPPPPTEFYTPPPTGTYTPPLTDAYSPPFMDAYTSPLTDTYATPLTDTAYAAQPADPYAPAPTGTFAPPPADAFTYPSPAYPSPRTSGPFFAVPEAEDEREPVRRGGGVLAGAVAGFLAAAVALGVANLVAAFVRPQASPIIAVGGAFIDRTPSWLKNFAVQKFGENDKTMLLLGMYVTIAVLAMVIGVIAWRHVPVGVAALALFGAFGAFVAVTRPESHPSDAIPSVVGGAAGIAAIIWLVRAGLSKSRSRTDRGGW